MTIAKVYGLGENPFEPTGAAVGKYPFVPPANFPMLEQKIEEAGIEKKVYALLVNSPHGAGKSTTMEHLKQKAINGAYLSFRAPVILTKLSSLSIPDFVDDILREVERQVEIKKPFGRPRYDLSPSRLREILVDNLSSIAAKKKLMLWIVDEFDILADQPKGEQQKFLQFLRGVVDDLASKDAPIAFIMSHTKYSSREFEQHLSEVHGPFKSRLVASLPLAYSFDEVKNIVTKRLKTSSKSPRREDDLSPFTEESLKSLYDSVLSIIGTESLDNFRVFERVCHFALIEGAKRGLEKINTELIQELFKEYGLKEIPMREGRRLNIKTTQEIATLKSKTLMEINEAILQGIVMGISKSGLLEREGLLSDVQTSYLGQVGTVGVSSLSLGLLHEGRSIGLFWVVATNKTGIFQEKDVKDVIQMTSSQLSEDKKYSHLRLLSYVSNIEVLKIPSNPFDTVMWAPHGLAEDLIGLSVCTDEDYNTLMKSFNAEIVPYLLQLLARETRDITNVLSSPTYEIIQTLFVMSAGGQSCTKSALREYNKRLFMRGSIIQEKYVKEVIQSGFAKEEAGQLKPSMPKAHTFLLGLLEDGPRTYQELLKNLGNAGEAIIGSALILGLIHKDGDQIHKRRLSEYENEILPTINSLQSAYENEIIKKSEPGKWIGWLLNAYNSTKKDGAPYIKYMIFSAVEYLGPQIEREIKRQISKPEKVAVEKIEPSAAPAITTPTQVGLTEMIKAPQAPSMPTKTIEEAILQIIQTSEPMTIHEIDNQMKREGYEEDIKRTVLQLVLKGKLRLILAG
jgi:hypothetical protein